MSALKTIAITAAEYLKLERMYPELKNVAIASIQAKLSLIDVYDKVIFKDTQMSNE